MKTDYRDLTWDPHKMRSDIKNQIKAFREDIAILKRHDEELYELIVQAIEEIEDE